MTDVCTGIRERKSVHVIVMRKLRCVPFISGNLVDEWKLGVGASVI